MKILWILTALVITSCGTATQSSHFEITRQDTLDLRKLKEHYWPKAYHTADTSLLKSILHEEFGLIDQSGGWYKKQDEIDYLKTNPTPPDSFYYEIKRLDIFKNGTAIICGTGHILTDTSETIYQSSNSLIKVNDQWKAINSHVSGVKSLD